MTKKITTMHRNSSEAVLKRYLERKIASLEPGDPMPPIRTMVKECGVSTKRLLGAIGQFESEELLECRPRRGIFRTSIMGKFCKPKVVDFVFFHASGFDPHPSVIDISNDSFFVELFRELSVENTRRNCNARTHYCSLGDSLAQCHSIAAQADISACILVNFQEREVARVFDRYQIPWVGLFPGVSVPSKGLVVDSLEMTDLQMNYLFELGHRRIAFVSPVVENAVTLMERREKYYRFMAERGMSVHPHWVVSGGYEEKEIFRAIEGVFAKDPTPTAIICADSQLARVYGALQEKGLRIGKDISVIGSDDLSIASHLYPRATSVRNSRKAVAHLALDMLEAVLEGRSIPPKQSIQLEIIERDSTGAVPVE